MSKNNSLIDLLEVALIGLGSFKENEPDRSKKQEIAEIADLLHQAIELLRDGDNFDQASISWKAIEKALIKYGIREIAEAILELL